jgi:hypothetical protein
MLELENQYRLNCNQAKAEAEMVRARQKMENAIRRRADLADERKRRKAAVDVMKYEMFCNEETVEAFRRYEQF